MHLLKENPHLSLSTDNGSEVVTLLSKNENKKVLFPYNNIYSIYIFLCYCPIHSLLKFGAK